MNHSDNPQAQHHVEWSYYYMLGQAANGFVLDLCSAHCQSEKTKFTRVFLSETFKMEGKSLERWLFFWGGL